MAYCASINCGYFFQGRNENYPSCHFDGPDGWAPCEVEDNEPDYPDDDYSGFTY